MEKHIFMYDVPKEKQEEYFKVTAEVIKPYWESHGCLSYTVWQTDDGSPAFMKEMLFEGQQSREQANDPEAKKVTGFFRNYAVNTQRKNYVQKV